MSVVFLLYNFLAVTNNTYFNYIYKYIYNYLTPCTRSIQNNIGLLLCFFGLISLYNGILTITGNLMLMPSLLKNDSDVIQPISWR